MSTRPDVRSRITSRRSGRGTAGRAGLLLLALCSSSALMVIAATLLLVADADEPHRAGSPAGAPARAWSGTSGVDSARETAAGAGAGAGTSADADGDAGAERLATSVRASLDALATAWADRDQPGFVAAAGSAAATRGAGAIWQALSALSVGRLDLHYVSAAAPLPRAGADSAAVVDVTWTQPGWEAPATTRLTVTFDGDAGESGGGVSFHTRTGSPAPVWALRPTHVKSAGRCTLVVLPGAGRGGRSPARLREMAITAGAEVDHLLAGRGELPGGRLVIVAPGSAAQFGQVLGESAGHYSGIAAVTTTVDGSGRVASPAQVVLNPAVFDRLGTGPAQVVLTHEATHALTGAAAGDMPLWVVEGFADYVALHDMDVPLRVSAGLALASVRRNGPPVELPGTEDFAVGAAGLGRAYEQAWLAFRLLEQRHGTAATVAFYDAVLDGRPVSAALRVTTGSDLATVTAQWRAELTRLARAAA